MKTSIYTLKDVLSETFSPIFESNNDRTARRDILANLRQNKQEVEDYELHCVGSVIRRGADEDDSKPEFNIVVLPSYKVELK